MKKIHTRSISDADISWITALAYGDNWNLGPHDLAALVAEDPEGFLVACHGDRPVGCVQACRYGTSFGFIGFHLVAAEDRGQGFGSQLWQAAMDRLAGRTIGVEGVFSKQSFYRTFGFTFHYSNIRHEYINNATPDATDARLADAEVLPFNQLLDFDYRHVGVHRPLFLRNWIHAPGATALGLRSGNVLKGFGCIRPCRRGYKVGPLYAELPEAAESIFLSLCARVPKGAAVYLDVPEKNTAASSICETFSMVQVSATARMYANGASALPLSRIYAIATLEQG